MGDGRVQQSTPAWLVEFTSNAAETFVTAYYAAADSPQRSQVRLFWCSHSSFRRSTCPALRSPGTGTQSAAQRSLHSFLMLSQARSTRSSRSIAILWDILVLKVRTCAAHGPLGVVIPRRAYLLCACLGKISGSCKDSVRLCTTRIGVVC